MVGISYRATIDLWVASSRQHPVPKRGGSAIFDSRTADDRRKCHTLPGGSLRFGLDWLALILGLSPLWGQSTFGQHSIATAPGENHLRNLRQLTNGGENAEAYFSHD